MIRHILLLAVAVLSPAALVAADHGSAQDLLTAATRQASLLEDSQQPFLLDIDFTAKFDVPRQGHLRLRWEARDRWWSKVTIAPFEQIKFQNGERTWTLRNVDFTPTQVDDLFNLIRFTKHDNQLVAKKDKQRVQNGIRMDCVEAEHSESNMEHHEICVDLSTQDIVSDRRKDRADDVVQMQFSDFVDFGGHRFPRRLELAKNGDIILTANVMDLKESSLDPQLLVPPQGAIERRECPNEKPPVWAGPAEADFRAVGGSRGSTRIKVTVLADGTVGEIHVLKSGGKAMDDAAIAALKKEKYKPAMCGAEPVTADVVVELNFQRY